MKKSKETMTTATTIPTIPTTSTTPTIEAKETPMAEKSVENQAVPEELSSPAEKALTLIKRELPELAEKVEHLVTLMNPDKPGYEEMGGARWSPPVVRIHQALSRNTPGNSKLGGLYTDTGDVLPTPWEFVPIYMHYANTKFTQGGDDDKNRLCRSEDTIKSTRGQVCADCPDRPFREGQITQCKKSIEVFVFDKEFQNIYKLQFVKTSYKTGSKLYRQTSSGSVPWERIYSLGTETATQKNTGAKYYVFTAVPTGEKTDTKFSSMARFIHEKISEARKRIKENIQNQVESTKDAISRGIPGDFAQGATAPAGTGDTKSGLTNM